MKKQIKQIKKQIIRELEGKTIERLQKEISNKHKDSFWYDGDIAKVRKPNGTELILIATGEIKIRDKNGYVVFDGKERNDGIKGGLKDDNDLKKIGNSNEDDYYWEFNNWFEVIFKKKNENDFDSVIGDVVYEYDDAIELLKIYRDDDDF